MGTVGKPLASYRADNQETTCPTPSHILSLWWSLERHSQVSLPVSPPFPGHVELTQPGRSRPAWHYMWAPSSKASRSQAWCLYGWFGGRGGTLALNRFVSKLSGPWQLAQVRNYERRCTVRGHRRPYSPSRCSCTLHSWSSPWSVLCLGSPCSGPASQSPARSYPCAPDFLQRSL